MLLFLGLFARLDGDADYHRRLAEATAEFSNFSIPWDLVIAGAEDQGLAPLFYYHLREAGIELPVESGRILKGLYLRHRRSWEVKTRVLREVVAKCEEAGISLVVLKGGALAHLLYPEPGLRPSSDLDFLVPEPQIPEARSVMAAMGFTWPSDRISPAPAYLQKHLPQAVLIADGETVKVDLHHHLLKGGRPHRMEGPEVAAAPLVFTLKNGGVTARTLGCEDTLRYLCLHFCGISHEPLSRVFGDTRLIWVADIIGFADRYADDIDWERVRKCWPYVLSTLSLLGLLTPLPKVLLSKVPAGVHYSPKGVGAGYKGWPGTPFARRGWPGLAPLLLDTFFPSEWWLRLYYGLGISGPLYYHRWLGHPLHMLTHFGRLVLRRLGGLRR